ncbi:autotransporter adhesin BpaC-like [Euwallacea fornicatus]|uniref:autotransporter adhesin BpaC-like n=1 Tax=Euwallacea fornicatus TaxID=995702 RepID=UPI00338F242E
MLLKCTVLVAVLVAVQSATLHGRNIPVEVRYERLEHDFNSNLSEKVQLSADELKENQLRLERPEERNSTKDHSDLNKNLEEKVQLSSEELLQAPKYVPIHDTLNQGPESNDLERLGEFREEPCDKVALIEKVQGIVKNGLENLKESFITKGEEKALPKEVWNTLEKDLNDYFAREKVKVESRQEQGATSQNIISNIINGFTQITSNVIQNFQNSANTTGTSGDEGTETQLPGQGIVGFFTGGVQSITNTIQNTIQSIQQGPGNSTTLGDSETQPSSGNPVGSFVNGIQQFFQRPQQVVNQITQTISNNNTQGDEGVTASASSGSNPFQQAFQAFGNFSTSITQSILGGQNKPEGSEDETSSQPNNIAQSFGQSIGNVFQNFQNLVRPPANSSNSGNNFIDQVSNVGSQIQQVASQVASNVIPGGSGTTSVESSTAAAESGDASTASAKLQTEEGSVKLENQEVTTEKAEDMTAME